MPTLETLLEVYNDCTIDKRINRGFVSESHMEENRWAYKVGFQDGFNKGLFVAGMVVVGCTVFIAAIVYWSIA